MFPASRYSPQSILMFALVVVAGVGLVSCGPTTKPGSQASSYDQAKDAFRSGQLDKALELTEKLAEATPPIDSTERSQVLRAVIYAGQLKANKELAEAYGKGAEKSKESQVQSDYHRLRQDKLLAAENAALNLARTAQQIAPNGVIPKDLTLEASFPTTEGPADIKELAPIEKGEGLEPLQQETVGADALRQGVDDALADVVAGDRAKARQALASGSTKLEGAAVAIFLAQELADGAIVFDDHHGLDPQKMQALCDEGDVTLKAALALLKDTPDKDQEKAVKKLQEKFKSIQKTT